MNEGAFATGTERRRTEGGAKQGQFQGRCSDCRLPEYDARPFGSSLGLLGDSSIDSPRDSDGEPWVVEGTRLASGISNLLIPFGVMAGFDPAIRRFESFHPSQLLFP